MKKMAIAIVAVILIGVFTSLALSRQPALPPRQIEPAQAPDAGLILHGRQLAALGDCAVCHTAPGGHPYAGGLRLKTPFGTIYSTNITPDNETGIGSWSEAAFERALRRGISLDGHLLYPAFPYIHFTGLSHDDIAALYAYVMNREPVSATAPANDLVFPLNLRPVIAGWNLFFLKPAQDPAHDTLQPRSAPSDTNVATQDSDWNRGRYLVNTLGHCAACHAPMNVLGAEKAGRDLSGGAVDGWDAPSLKGLAQTSHPWTHEQLTVYLKTGIVSQHSAAMGPMQPVTHELSNVNNADVSAIATYLLSLDNSNGAPPAAPLADSAPPQADTGDTQRMKAGAAIFEAACASCHAAGAPMQSAGGRPALGDTTTLNDPRANNAILAVLNGNGWHDNHATPYMPAFASMLSDQEVADVVTYIRATYAHPGPDVDASLVAKIRKASHAP